MIGRSSRDHGSGGGVFGKSGLGFSNSSVASLTKHLFYNTIPSANFSSIFNV